MIELSNSKELEQLQDRRTKLEEESNSLEQQQRNLDSKVKTLEERIKINELESINKTKREAITQLESRINELEQKLKPQEETKSYESMDQDSLKTTEEVTTTAPETVEEEPANEVVDTGVIEDPMLAEQEEFSENLKRQNEKKKRKFF